MTTEQPTNSPHAPGAAPSGGATLVKTVKGTAWVVAWRMATRTLGLISTIVLVRLLQPSDFGLLALATSFTQSVEALSYFGIEEALIREKSPSRTTYDTAFTLALLRAVTLTCMISALAYPAARFFSEPRLAVVVLSLAIATLLDGFNNVGTVDFRRHFNFDQEFKLWILPRVLSTAAAILVAALTRSYWALVVAVMVGRTIRLVSGYVMHPYRPSLTLRDWRKLTSYSVWTWVYGIASMVSGQADTFMIGRSLNTSSVGFYSVGAEMALLPQTELVEPLSRTAFSAFSEHRRLGQPVANIWLRMASAAAMLVLPACFGISLVAPNLLRVFFGDTWLAATSVVQVMAAASGIVLFGSISNCMFQAYGQLKLMVSIRVTMMVVRIALLATLLPLYGLPGAALAVAIAMLIEHSAFSVAAFRQMGASVIRDLLPMLWRCLVAVAVMAFTLTEAGLGWGSDFTGLNPYVWLFSVSGLGAAIYGVTLISLWLISGKPHGPEADLLDMTQRMLSKLAFMARQILHRLLNKSQPGQMQAADDGQSGLDDV